MPHRGTFRYMPLPLYLTTEEVADILRLKRRTIQLKIRDGQIAAVNLGSEARPSYRITQQELDRYIAERAAA